MDCAARLADSTAAKAIPARNRVQFDMDFPLSSNVVRTPSVCQYITKLSGMLIHAESSTPKNPREKQLQRKQPLARAKPTCAGCTSNRRTGSWRRAPPGQPV